jgi:hypothetical protein
LHHYLLIEFEDLLGYIHMEMQQSFTTKHSKQVDLCSLKPLIDSMP